MAVVLGDVMKRGGHRARVEAALLRLATDSDEYVRRRALESLARTGSVHAERVALAAWNEVGKNAPWSRMMALWALKEVRSHCLDPLLREAMTSDNEFLREFATKLHAGPPARPQER